MGEKSDSYGDLLQKGLGFRDGERNKVRFWLDDWLGAGPLLRVFPRFFRLASNKWSCVKDCYVGEDGSMSWVVPFRFRRVLRQ